MEETIYRCDRCGYKIKNLEGVKIIAYGILCLLCYSKWIKFVNRFLKKRKSKVEA